MLDDLMREVQTIAESYAFIRAIADLDRTDNALRLRLIIDETMFIQVYANSKKNKLNFAPSVWDSELSAGTVKKVRGTNIPSHLPRAIDLKGMPESP